MARPRPDGPLERRARTTAARVTGAGLLRALRLAEEPLARAGRQLAIEIDPRAVQLADLGPPEQLTGLDAGQLADLRWPLADGRGLHLHVTPAGLYRFHLDRVCALRRPLGHLWADTDVARCLSLAACLAAPVAIWSPWSACAVIFAGAVVGGLRPKRPLWVLRYSTP